MASSRLPQETAPEKKRKEFRTADGEEQRQVKKFKNYNFTPLNAEISEVLMEIKEIRRFGNHKRYQVILLRGIQASIVIFINK
jgi:hypothetical protein